jgi:hypothetical protein
MEMEMAVEETRVELNGAVDRLTATAAILEQAAERFAGVELQASLERVGQREAELEQRLAEAEATIESLRAEALARPAGRKTTPAGAATGVGALVSRDGVAVEAGALDGALRSLSIEQRIAVKAEMLRAGLIG